MAVHGSSGATGASEPSASVAPAASNERSGNARSVRPAQLASAASRSSRACAGWTLAVRPSRPKRAKSSLPDKLGMLHPPARSRPPRRRSAPPRSRRRRSRGPPARSLPPAPGPAGRAAPASLTVSRPVAAVRVRVHAVRRAGIERAVDQHLERAHPAAGPPPPATATCPHAPQPRPGPDPADRRPASTRRASKPPAIARSHTSRFHVISKSTIPTTPRAAAALPASPHPRIHHRVRQLAQLPGQCKRRLLAQQPAARPPPPRTVGRRASSARRSGGRG